MTTHRCNAYCEGEIHAWVLYSSSDDLILATETCRHWCTAAGYEFIDARPATEPLPSEEYFRKSHSKPDKPYDDGTVKSAVEMTPTPYAYLVYLRITIAECIDADSVRHADISRKLSAWRRMLRWFQRS